MDEAAVVPVAALIPTTAVADRESARVPSPHPVDRPTYEELLNRDPRWALSEGSRHFEEASAVFQTLRRIADRLCQLQIPYAVVGGMALFQHGLRRFTEDVDILVTRADLKRVHEALEGLGYLKPHAASKNLRDVVSRVRIEFLTTGDFPGDGKAKPVAFPDPAGVSFEADGVRYVNLSTLIELKLASGMTNAARLKDLADVLELIKVVPLEIGFGEQLNPYVREKYRELWKQARKRYISIWRHPQLTAEMRSLSDIIARIPNAPAEFAAMLQDGVIVDDVSDVSMGAVRLVTADPIIASKYGLIDEAEFWEHG